MDVFVRLVAAVVALVVVAATWRRALSQQVAPTEERVFRRFNDATGAIHLPVWTLMQAGSFGAVLVATGLLALRDEDSEALVTLVTGTVVWAGVKRLKHYVGRGRPGAHLARVTVRGQAQTGLGYPSGHAAVSMTLALVVFQGAHPGLQTTAIVVALMVGGARMYVGAHLPLDVAGGVALGVAVGTLTAASMTL